MFNTRAIVHSIKDQDEVTILHKDGPNDVVAEYKGIRYTAIYNGFVGQFYVDDLYGKLPNQHLCLMCHVAIP